MNRHARGLAGPGGRRWRLPWLAVAVWGLVLVASGCAAPTEEPPLAPRPVPTPVATPAPIQLPRDEAPHDNLTEWWYYTGHLQAADGRRYGFEFVIFQTVRGDYPVVYLGQFAVTDRSRQQFRHAYRLSQGSQIGRLDQLELAVQDWRLRSDRGSGHLSAAMEEYALELGFQTRKPAAFHDDDGIVSFGPAGLSYYYSYTRLAVQGTLIDHGSPLPVQGEAWFDHQWGDFLVLGGGWDWFSIQLDDGSELMLNHLRDDQQQVVGVWGTYIDPDGRARALHAGDFVIEPTGSWTSPASGGTYPMGWQVRLREPPYQLQLNPALLDQELVSQGDSPTYWEGAVDITGTRDGRAVAGQGYVELTGYAPR